ncbi:hypothetical protein GMB70_13015 [Turicibacter sanguinis]|nr:hypothetical protein [Turicibacter sanguinis]
MPNVVLFAHGTHENRGCEAIVRGTTKLLKKANEHCNVKVGSYNPELDQKRNIDSVDEYLLQGSIKSRYSKEWFRHLIQGHLFRDEIGYYQWVHRDVVNEIKKADLTLSVGGDNYCYDTPVWVYALNRAVKELSNSKLVLFGASIEPDYIDEEMKANLDLHDALIVRESLTFEGLKRVGLENKTFLCPDPAFTMNPEKVELSDFWDNGKIIGLNISPLIMEYEKNPGLVKKATERLVSHLLNNTEFKIALICHVSTDIEVLQPLFDKFKSNRMVLIGNNYNAKQLKYIISKCHLFIGARTHATIAAYSTCVPTLVIGYSIKARGIAKDLFGDSTGLILPVQNLENEEQLIEIVMNFIDRKDELRNQLNLIMPNYKLRAYESINIINNLLK